MKNFKWAVLTGIFFLPQKRRGDPQQAAPSSYESSAIEGGVALTLIIRILILYSTPNHAGI